MVTITQKEETKEEMDEARQRAVKKRTILVMARLHPGESPASYVVQGNIEIIVVNGVSYFYFFFFLRTYGFSRVETQNSCRAKGEINIQSVNFSVCNYISYLY